MALVLADLVEETTTTSGTGTLSLGGKTSRGRTFVEGIGSGNDTIYGLRASDGNFEVAYGVVTDSSPDTLTRGTLIASSTGSRLNLPVGTHTVFCTFSASLLDDYQPLDATILKQADVDDTPVNGVTTAPISSNWAYDHAAAADPHPGYRLESASIALESDVTGDLPFANFIPATAASVLLGRGSASAGDFQEITLGSNLSISGTTLSASGVPAVVGINVNTSLTSAAHANTKLECTGGPISLTVNTSTALANRDFIEIDPVGGDVTFIEGSGVTIESASGSLVVPRYTAAVLIGRGSHVYTLIGPSVESGIEEAPIDGKPYFRMNGAWVGATPYITIEEP